MHHTAQYNFPAPILNSRGSVQVSAPYATYNPRTATVVTSPPTPTPAATTSARSSSATEFRGSTNPSEDWTKISDLAERRRIQNRIAQRNYRKKLKRRLEDLERRAQSRSLSPNGEDTDGRSTRESSTDQQNGGAPTSSNEGSTITVTAPGGSSPPTTSYEYSPSYSATTTSATPYPSQYRTAGGYTASASPPSHYMTSPQPQMSAYDPSANQFMYSPYAEQGHHHQHPHHQSSTAHHGHQHSGSDHHIPVDPSFLLPLPPLMSSSANTTPASSAASSPAQRSHPGMSLKTANLYDLDSSSSPATSTVSPYVLSANSYDSMHDQYSFSPAGVSSSYYNLDNLSPLPPLQYNGNTTSSSPSGYQQRVGARMD